MVRYDTYVGARRTANCYSTFLFFVTLVNFVIDHGAESKWTWFFCFLCMFGTSVGVAQAMSATSNNQQRRPLIIFCHGSGDTGAGAQAWIQSLIPISEYEQWDWLFPSAKPIPYQLNGGITTSVWYDRADGFDPTFPEQTLTVEASTDRLLSLIDEQIQHHRSPNEIFIGGFSMGGAIAYQAAARYHARTEVNFESLGAVFGLSCYLNNDSKVWNILQEQDTTKRWPPTYIAHGASDDFISPEWGKATYERLVEAGVQQASFQLVSRMHHEMIHQEIADLLSSLKTIMATTISDTKQGAEIC